MTRGDIPGKNKLVDGTSPGLSRRTTRNTFISYSGEQLSATRPPLPQYLISSPAVGAKRTSLLDGSGQVAKRCKIADSDEDSDGSTVKVEIKPAVPGAIDEPPADNDAVETTEEESIEELLALLIRGKRNASVQVDQQVDMSVRIARPYTKIQYQAYWRLFKDYCDRTQSHSEYPYDVTEFKAMCFMKDVMFNRKTYKWFYLDRPYPGLYPVYRSVADIPPNTSLLSAPSKNEKEPANMPEKIVVDLAAILETLPLDRVNRRRRLDMPIGVDDLNAALKSLQYLVARQKARTLDPNMELMAKWRDIIPDAIQEYERGIIMGGMSLDEDDLPVCPIRNTYSVVNHIRLLLDCWLEITPDDDDEDDDEDEDEVKKGDLNLTERLREHLGIAVRHSMLLRDEDFRFLNQADCTIIPVKKENPQQQTINMLVFHLCRDKSSKNKYGVALRHNDVRRCSVGAFAFYLFNLWQNPENVPNFLTEDWKKQRLVFSTKDFGRPLSFEESRASFSRVLHRQWLRLAYPTVCGRLSGRQEAKVMALPDSVLEVGGRLLKLHGTRHSAIKPKRPEDHLPFARGMAGFWGRTFHIRRNEVVPSFALQRMVFPFIEDALYDPSTPEHERWIERCRRAMLDIDQLDPPDNEDYALEESFLLSLARLRRVVLQDAAAYVHIKQCEKAWGKFEIPLLQAHPEIFTSMAFQNFQSLVSQALARVDVRTLTPPPPPPPPSVSTVPPSPSATEAAPPPSTMAASPSPPPHSPPSTFSRPPSQPDPPEINQDSPTSSPQLQHSHPSPVDAISSSSPLPLPQEETESVLQPTVDHPETETRDSGQRTVATTQPDIKTDDEQCQRIINLLKPSLDSLFGRMDLISRQLADLHAKMESLQSTVNANSSQSTSRQSPSTTASVVETLRTSDDGDRVVANTASNSNNANDSTNNHTANSNNADHNSTHSSNRDATKPSSVHSSPSVSSRQTRSSSPSPSSSVTTRAVNTKVEIDRFGYAWPATVQDIWASVQPYRQGEKERERLLSCLTPAEKRMVHKRERIIEYVEYLAGVRRKAVEAAIADVERLKRDSGYSMELLWKACDGILKDGRRRPRPQN